MHEGDSVRKVQLYPLIIRPRHTYAFDFVRSGNTAAVRELLQSRHLSVLDRSLSGSNVETLLEVSAVYCNLA